MNKFLWLPSFSPDFWTLLELGQDPFLHILQMIGQYLSQTTILAFSSPRCQHSSSVRPRPSPSFPPDVSTVPQTMILAFSSYRFHHRTSVRPRSLHSVPPDVRTVPQLDHDHCLQFLQISTQYLS